MGWTEFLLARVDTPLGRTWLRLTNALLRPPCPLPVRVRRQTIYAASLDRLAALWLTKAGNAERFEMDLWSDSLRPGMVVADVGANLGLYTLLAAERVGPAGRVHSFEPDPQNAALLRRNVAANSYGNIVLHEAAVADREGVVALHRCPEHHGDHRIYGVARGRRPTVDVRLTTLDAALRDVPRLDLVKVDIQGSEWQAIEGMRGLIERNPHLTLFFEYWPEGLRASGGDPAAFARRLHGLGFRIWHVNGRRETLEELDERGLIRLSESPGYTNLLARRNAA